MQRESALDSNARVFFLIYVVVVVVVNGVTAVQSKTSIQNQARRVHDTLPPWTEMQCTPRS